MLQRRKGKKTVSERSIIGGRIGQDGERSNSYSVAVINGIKRK